jgi:uncharacterized membrane protein YvbJ
MVCVNCGFSSRDDYKLCPNCGAAQRLRQEESSYSLWVAGMAADKKEKE